MSDTIFALSSGAGRAGVAVIRVSGPDAGAGLETLLGTALPQPRMASLRHLKDRDGSIIDHGLVLWFPGPASFTGEDCVEYQVHGGRAVIDSLLKSLAAQENCRPAEPGEFTRRAFDNGKMDLTAVEGLADLIDAETEAQRKQAMRQMSGGLFHLYEGWSAELKNILAWIEADIDFADEELPDDLFASLQPRCEKLYDAIHHHLNDNRRSERLRDGLMIAILGAPNAGKSSLLNVIAKRDAAIVSDRAGTTRDVIDIHLDLNGFPATIADTAGLRETADDIEEEGIRRARDRAEDADLKIVIFDAASLDDPDESSLALVDQSALVVVNKTDLTDKSLQDHILAGHTVLPVSVKDGTGLDAFLARLEQEVSDRFAGSEQVLGPTRLRHRAALGDSLLAMDRFFDGLDGHQETALLAEDLRMAMRALGRLTGRVDVEDLLDVIFRDFCIGK